MESKIIHQEKNPFLHREEFIIEFKSESNPSFDDIRKVLGKDDELVVVKKINSNFGRKSFTAETVVYDSKESKEKIETSPKKIKKKSEGAKPGPSSSQGSPVGEEKTEQSGQPIEEEQKAKPEQTEEKEKTEVQAETKPEEKIEEKTE